MFTSPFSSVIFCFIYFEPMLLVAYAFRIIIFSWWFSCYLSMIILNFMFDIFTIWISCDPFFLGYWTFFFLHICSSFFVVVKHFLSFFFSMVPFGGGLSFKLVTLSAKETNSQHKIQLFLKYTYWRVWK